ncbi:hypothetical protein L1987_46455 [Smallanthus sonchifolius]|uniref:Uncharacterized protein n=1 Tax=Smallanthus sonchifolius TaxID=185202 RepID=A0ACB9G1J2_9ASTR|nr:hypothetical protein L1987_46455 [Smallanthus sonchifolius]
MKSNNYAAIEETSTSTPMPSPEKPATVVNPIMAIVLVCLLSAFFMLCVVSTYFRHYAERQLRLAASTTHGSETGSMRSGAHGLDPAVISTFATFLYSSVKDIKLGQTVLECAVCLNEFKDHETLRLLPKCSHMFHRDCIDTWLASHVTCPVCRADLVPRPNELGHVTEPERDCSSTEFLLPMESKHMIPVTTHMPRSHSTGHSVVENIERYTLRLPNGAQGPHMVFPMESSEKVTFRSVSVGSTRGLDYVRYERSNLERPRGEMTTSENDSSRISNS